MLRGFSYKFPRPGGQRGERRSSMDNASTNSAHASWDGSAGDTTISSTDFARRCRELMSLYRDLLALGAKAIFDLPRIVVIGGQSSGKSSLVEAVSGINVPRDSGTCTRCPMVCTMSSGTGTWSCNIEISYEFDRNGQPRQNPRTIAFGPASIENKNDIELWIRRAQAAVLSPHRSPSEFLTMSNADIKENAKKDEEKMLKFSKNIINVNVRDANATDLSFVDLPGLIQNADPSVINEVRTLVESYVVGKNTLIVVAMPMTDDIEMMQALVIAGDADPEKARTIGVMTKANFLREGSIGGKEKWKAVLEGREHRTTHGYYCVRLPDDSERQQKLSRSEALRLSANFFDTNLPWSKMADRSRFGIPNFVRNISALLVELIEKNLPDLTKAVEEELAQCDAELDALPPLSDVEPFTEVILRVNAFCKDVADTIHGLSSDKHFLHLNKARYLKFKDDILMTTPDFRPCDRDEMNHLRSLVTTLTEPRWLCDIRKVIKGTVGWELPGEIPFEATKALIMQYTGLWPAPSKLCFNDICSYLYRYVEETSHKHFGQFKHLERYASGLIFEELSGCSADAGCSLEKVLVLESSPIFTQNFASYSSEKAKWLAEYKAARRATPPMASGTILTAWTPTLSPVSTPPGKFYTFPLPTGTGLDATPGTWSVDEELRVIANVQAYFQVAHQKIIDYVPLTIEHGLNQAFSNRINKNLLGNIFRDAAAGKTSIEELLQEDSVLKQRRKDLNERKARLVQIKEKLDNFGCSDDVA